MDSTAAIISAICAALAVGISLYSVYKTKQRLEVRQHIHKNIEYKGITSNGKYWYNKIFLKRNENEDNGEGRYRVIVDLILINKSAVNITILNYVLNDKLILSSDFICEKNTYDINFKDKMDGNDFKIDRSLGDNAGGKHNVKSVRLNSKIFPLVTLQPYEVKAGQLVFCTERPEQIRKGKNKLAIDIGNQTIITPIQIGAIEDTKLL